MHISQANLILAIRPIDFATLLIRRGAEEVQLPKALTEPS